MAVHAGSRLEVIKNSTLRILDEASISIMRSGYSTLIKEIKDLSVSSCLHSLRFSPSTSATWYLKCAV